MKSPRMRGARHTMESYDGGPTRFSVVIPVHGALDEFERCFSSVIESFNPELDELLVVDDFSDCESFQMVLGDLSKVCGVRVLRNSHRVGYPTSANRGAFEARAPTIILLNSDTRVRTGWLEAFEKAFLENPDFGVLGPISDNAGFSQTIKERPPDEALVEPERLPRKLGLPKSRRPISCLDLNGFCLAIRSEVISNIGLFDEATFGLGYGEELDFFARLRHSRWLAGIVPSVYVEHAKQKSFSDEEVRRLKKENMLAIKQRYGRLFFLQAWLSRLRSKVLVRLLKVF